jgi:DNA-binding IclR family transcriptional regulator
MTRFQKENMKIRILRLITRRSTGTPEELALKLDVSIRTVKRLIHELKEEGYYIRYSRMSRSYIPA